MRRFIQKHKKWAVDERCHCGHGRAKHAGREGEVGGRPVCHAGLGRCNVPGCDCARFRRHGWVFEGEQQPG